MQFTKSSILTLALAALFTGCDAPVDYYSRLAPTCNYLSARTDSGPNGLILSQHRNTLTGHDDCKAALLENLNLDDSVLSLPSLDLNRVLEAFQVLVAYPIDLKTDASQVQLYGLRGDFFPPLLYCRVFGIFYPDLCDPFTTGSSNSAQNTNQALVNYLLNGLQKVKYSEAIVNAYAEANFGDITLFDSFFYSERSAFENAGTILHERFHLDSAVHVRCATDGARVCDSDLRGPHGFQVFYAQNLLDQNAQATLPSGQTILSRFDISRLSLYICEHLDYINTLPPALTEWLEPTLGEHPHLDCYPTAGRTWIREHAPQWSREAASP